MVLTRPFAVGSGQESVLGALGTVDEPWPFAASASSGVTTSTTSTTSTSTTSTVSAAAGDSGAGVIASTEPATSVLAPSPSPIPDPRRLENRIAPTMMITAASATPTRRPGLAAYLTTLVAISSETRFITLSSGLMAGPAVSLNGSPTVSPMIVASWASEPLPP